MAGDARHLCYCHCRSCRLASGAPFVAWGTFDPARFEIVAGTLAQVTSSTGVRRGFCAHCGTSISYRNEKRPDEIDLTLATLDDAPEALAPRCHIWVSHGLRWAVPEDGLPRYERWREDPEA